MKNNNYTIVVLVVVAITYFFPEYFITVGESKLTDFITPVLQLIMFGMGTTITAQDFVGILKTPKKVGIGIFLQFFIMPLWGFGLVKIFSFPPEIAAGVLLIGCSPSGLASNVIALLAKANVPLSITITTIATMVAPFATPFLMKFLGGELVEVNALKMMWDMCKIVLIPVFIGFMLNKFLPKVVSYIKEYLPLVSMAGILYVIATITAAGKSSLEAVGVLLFLTVLLHNLGGYVFGYFSARALGMDEKDSRTVSIEVGMQNGGLASALAVEMGKAATVGLAAAIFGPLMNITGSLLAGFWGNRETK